MVRRNMGEEEGNAGADIAADDQIPSSKAFLKRQLLAPSVAKPIKTQTDNNNGDNNNIKTKGGDNSLGPYFEMLSSQVDYGNPWGRTSAAPTIWSVASSDDDSSCFSSSAASQSSTSVSSSSDRDYIASGRKNYYPTPPNTSQGLLAAVAAASAAKSSPQSVTGLPLLAQVAHDRYDNTHLDSSLELETDDDESGVRFADETSTSEHSTFSRDETSDTDDDGIPVFLPDAGGSIPQQQHHHQQQDLTQALPESRDSFWNRMSKLGGRRPRTILQPITEESTSDKAGNNSDAVLSSSQHDDNDIDNNGPIEEFEDEEDIESSDRDEADSYLETSNKQDGNGILSRLQHFLQNDGGSTSVKEEEASFCSSAAASSSSAGTGLSESGRRGTNVSVARSEGTDWSGYARSIIEPSVNGSVASIPIATMVERISSSSSSSSSSSAASQSSGYAQSLDRDGGGGSSYARSIETLDRGGSGYHHRSTASVSGFYPRNNIEPADAVGYPQNLEPAGYPQRIDTGVTGNNDNEKKDHRDELSVPLGSSSSESSFTYSEGMLSTHHEVDHSETKGTSKIYAIVRRLRKRRYMLVPVILCLVLFLILVGTLVGVNNSRSKGDETSSTAAEDEYNNSSPTTIPSTTAPTKSPSSQLGGSGGSGEIIHESPSPLKLELQFSQSVADWEGVADILSRYLTEALLMPTPLTDGFLRVELFPEESDYERSRSLRKMQATVVVLVGYIMFDAPSSDLVGAGPDVEAVETITKSICDLLTKVAQVQGLLDPVLDGTTYAGPVGGACSDVVLSDSPTLAPTPRPSERSAQQIGGPPPTISGLSPAQPPAETENPSTSILLVTATPTDLPTASPTSSTAAPTGASPPPIGTPSASPSSPPSAAPTMRPSMEPTPAPTTPTPPPTVAIVPTTPEPSALPTASPSSAPSAAPTPEPPSVSPSAVPSWSPTESPTPYPTVRPTSESTFLATLIEILGTSEPSSSPTMEESSTPTLEPSPSPSSSPSESPSFAPSNIPTPSPTASPTLSPTTSLPSAAPVTPTSSPVVVGNLPQKLQLTLDLESSPENVHWILEHENEDGSFTTLEGTPYSNEEDANKQVTEDLPFTIGPNGSTQLKITIQDKSPLCNSDMVVCTRGYGMYKVSYGDVDWDYKVSPLSVKSEATFTITLFADGSSNVIQSRSSVQKLYTGAAPKAIFEQEAIPDQGPFIKATLSFENVNGSNIGMDLRQFHDDGTESILYDHPVGTFTSHRNTIGYRAVTMYMPIPVDPKSESPKEPRHFEISVQDLSGEAHCCWNFKWELFDESGTEVFESDISNQGEKAPTKFTESFYMSSDGLLTFIESTPNIFSP